MTMPPEILCLTADLQNFLMDIEHGIRPAWTTLERAGMKFVTLKYQLHVLPRHEEARLDPGNEANLLPGVPGNE